MAELDRGFDAMRQDAIRRSREMQRRAAPLQPPAATQSPQEAAPPPAAPEHKSAEFRIPEMLQGFLQDWDAEKIGLAGLLWVLYKEGADPALLLALAYILL